MRIFGKNKKPSLEISDDMDRESDDIICDYGNMLEIFLNSPEVDEHVKILGRLLKGYIDNEICDYHINHEEEIGDIAFGIMENN